MDSLNKDGLCFPCPYTRTTRISVKVSGAPGIGARMCDLVSRLDWHHCLYHQPNIRTDPAASTSVSLTGELGHRHHHHHHRHGNLQQKQWLLVCALRFPPHFCFSSSFLVRQQNSACVDQQSASTSDVSHSILSLRREQHCSSQPAVAAPTR